MPTNSPMELVKGLKGFLSKYPYDREMWLQHMPKLLKCPFESPKFPLKNPSNMPTNSPSLPYGTFQGILKGFLSKYPYDREIWMRHPCQNP
jgi:hypothetical protein